MTTAPTFDLTPFLGRDEGQHFDRKSMFEGEEGKKRPRVRRKVRDQVAEQVAGFANAEGGVLVDVGIVRDQGEGIPRMFAEMEGFFLITLRNTATLTADDKPFVARLGDAELTDVEFRALLGAHRAGRLDNARLRAISGLDTLGASALLRRLRDRELLALHAAGPNSFYELGPKAQLPVDVQGLEADRPEPTSDRPGSERDRPELPADLAAAVKALGTRPRQGPLRVVIASLCSWRPLKPAELGSIVGIRADNLTQRHFMEMVAEGRLRLTLSPS
jgi:hypothetical protein